MKSMMILKKKIKNKMLLQDENLIHLVIAFLYMITKEKAMIAYKNELYENTINSLKIFGIW